MKRLISLMVLSFMLPLSAMASASNSYLFPPLLVAAYATWADFLGVPDFSDKMSTTSPDDEISETTCDTLIVYSSRKTLEFDHAILVYRYPGFDNDGMDTRAMALFAAAEYGNPSGYSSRGKKGVVANVNSMLEKLQKTIASKADRIQAGEIVNFYVSETAVYSIFQIGDGMMAIAIE